MDRPTQTTEPGKRGLMDRLREALRPPQAEAAALDTNRNDHEQALIDALADPVLLITAESEVSRFNSAAEALLPGLRPAVPLVLVLRAPGVAEAVRRAVTAGERSRVEYAERVPIERWFAAHVAPLGPARNEVLITVQELTEARRIEKMRVDFIASASHELRTPLASILGFIETLLGPARNDTTARERFLGIMLSQARRMTRLIDDLLSLSRIENNEHIRPSARIELKALIGHVKDTLSPLAADHGITLEVITADRPLPVAGDRDELIRLFENLVQNAVKYGENGKKVTITLAHRQNGAKQEAEVSVRDYGPGIPAEHLPRLTERFYRVDLAESRNKGGTGLGLAIVKHIVSRHRARLNITSEAGQGACFTVTFDLMEG